MVQDVFQLGGMKTYGHAWQFNVTISRPYTFWCAVTFERYFIVLSVTGGKMRNAVTVKLVSKLQSHDLLYSFNLYLEELGSYPEIMLQNCFICHSDTWLARDESWCGLFAAKNSWSVSDANAVENIRQISRPMPGWVSLFHQHVSSGYFVVYRFFLSLWREHFYIRLGSEEHRQERSPEPAEKI
jgi:hypothetical protein